MQNRLESTVALIDVLVVYVASILVALVVMGALVFMDDDPAPFEYPRAMPVAFG